MTLIEPNPAVAQETKTILNWQKLPVLPDREGFAGPFAGVHNGALIVAGGANFPDKRPWEGGTKVWYDSVFVLEKPDGPWKTGFKLPRPLARIFRTGHHKCETSNVCRAFLAKTKFAFRQCVENSRT